MRLYTRLWHQKLNIKLKQSRQCWKMVRQGLLCPHWALLHAQPRVKTAPTTQLHPQSEWASRKATRTGSCCVFEPCCVWIFDPFIKSTCDITLASLQECTCSDVPQVYQLQHWCWEWGGSDRCGHQVPDMIQWDRVMSHRGLERVPPLNLQRVPYDRLFIAPPQPSLPIWLHLSSVLPWNATCWAKCFDFWRL